MKEFLSLLGFGEVWGIFPGYVGKIIEMFIHEIRFGEKKLGTSDRWSPYSLNAPLSWSWDFTCNPGPKGCHENIMFSQTNFPKRIFEEDRQFW